MGSAMSFYNLDQASNRLKKSKRSIHNYIKRGLLRREIQDGIAGVNAGDVEDLFEKMELGMPALNRRAFVEMESRLSRVERVLEVMCLATGINIKPLRANKGDLMSLYASCKAALKSTKWQHEEIDTWLEILPRIDELVLSELAIAATDTTPWVPFFSLCKSMCEQILIEFPDNQTLAMEKRLSRLEESKKHLRQVAFVWMETTHTSVPELFDNIQDSDKDALMHRLSKRSGK